MMHLAYRLRGFALIWGFHIMRFILRKASAPEELITQLLYREDESCSTHTTAEPASQESTGDTSSPIFSLLPDGDTISSLRMRKSLKIVAEAYSLLTFPPMKIGLRDHGHYGVQLLAEFSIRDGEDPIGISFMLVNETPQSLADKINDFIDEKCET